MLQMPLASVLSKGSNWGAGKRVEIPNKSDIDASWFCYNSYDDAKWIALGSGDLPANGGTLSYDPPRNSTGNYYIRFTRKGGGAEIAGSYSQRARR
jgi:hypothetical protein